ncbi:MAG: hypothetical protein IJ743_01635 [Bacilli bacterium]|nr:hypothetical protein [Bacilli bacterium]
MELELQRKLLEDSKMYQHLKENSFYMKQLNRNPEFYKEFTKIMKEQYHDRVTDKIGDAIDNLDFISSILSSLR